MKRLATITLVLSFIGGVVFLRAYYLVTFAAGYGLSSADRNQVFYLAGSIGSAALLFVSGGYLFKKAVKKS